MAHGPPLVTIENKLFRSKGVPIYVYKRKQIRCGCTIPNQGSWREFFQILTPNQLYTVLISIQACLNSRPIAAISDVPSDLEVYLTPGHFIAGRPLLQRPQAGDVIDLPVKKLTNVKRWCRHFGNDRSGSI